MHLSGSARLSFQITTLLYIAVQTSSHSLTHKVVENFFLSDTENTFGFGGRQERGKLPTWLLACYCLPLWSVQHQVTVPQPPFCAIFTALYTFQLLFTGITIMAPSLYMTLLQLAHTHTRLIDGSVWRQVVGKEARVGTYSGAAYCDMGPILFLAYFSPAAQKEHDAHVVVML